MLTMCLSLALPHSFSIQAIVEELEQKLEQCHHKGQEDDAATEMASKAATKTPGLYIGTKLYDKDWPNMLEIRFL